MVFSNGSTSGLLEKALTNCSILFKAEYNMTFNSMFEIFSSPKKLFQSFRFLTFYTVSKIPATGQLDVG